MAEVPFYHKYIVLPSLPKMHKIHKLFAFLVILDSFMSSAELKKKQKPNSFTNTIRVSNNFDLDQAQSYVCMLRQSLCKYAVLLFCLRTKYLNVMSWLIYWCPAHLLVPGSFIGARLIYWCPAHLLVPGSFIGTWLIYWCVLLQCSPFIMLCLEFHRDGTCYK